MNTSEQINEIAAALAKAQSKIKTAVKDSTNPHFRSKYADLASVREACADALSANDIAVVQAHGFDGAHVTLTTRLVHKSGQWLESVYLIKPTKEDPQGYASATTYARRISLSSMVGVVADEDDDGNAASQRNGSHAPPPQEDTGLAAAKAFVRRSVKEIGALTSATALSEWKAKMDGHLAPLLDKYPDEGAAVMSALMAQAQAFKAAAE
jgi:hypothetical protein